MPTPTLTATVTLPYCWGGDDNANGHQRWWRCAASNGCVQRPTVRFRSLHNGSLYRRPLVLPLPTLPPTPSKDSPVSSNGRRSACRKIVIELPTLPLNAATPPSILPLIKRLHLITCLIRQQERIHFISIYVLSHDPRTVPHERPFGSLEPPIHLTLCKNTVSMRRSVGYNRGLILVN